MKKTFDMENNEIKRNLYRVLRKTGVKKENITPDANFEKDLHFDTTDWTIFTYYLENIFKINVKDESIQNLHSVQDTIALIVNAEK